MPAKRELTKKEFDLFVESIQGRNGFLSYCKSFHEKEKRDLVYVISCDLFSSGNKLKQLASIDIILMIWNMAWYIKTPREQKINLGEDIWGLIEKYNDNYSILRSKSISSFDEETQKLVKQIFEESEKKLGRVGASKFLHILNPKLFPLWDTKIAHHYHKYRHQRRHREMSVDCYIKFIEDNIHITRNLLKDISEEDLWRQHKNEVPSDVFENFPKFGETVLKMLDECNYSGITEKLRKHY